MKLVLFVDVQNDFVDGSLGVDKNHKISDRILKYARRCFRSGATTIATMDTHDDETYLDSFEGDRLPVKHCIKDTEGWELYGNLNRYISGIALKSTFMADVLGEAVDKIETLASINEVEICGFCTSICVISNALFLRCKLPDTKITILENLCGDVNPESHKAALKVAQNCQIDVKTVKI